jgi:hypothetical protein
LSGDIAESSNEGKGTAINTERSAGETGECIAFHGKAGAEASLQLGYNVSPTLCCTKEAMVAHGFDSYNQVTYKEQSQTLKAHEGGDSVAKVVVGQKLKPEAIGYDGYNQALTHDVAMSITSGASDIHHVPGVLTPKTMQIRCGCEGGGKGALIQDNKSATLSCNNIQTLFAPIVGECLTPWDVQSRRIHEANGKWPALYGGEGGGHGYALINNAPLTQAYSIDTSHADDVVRIDEKTVPALQSRMYKGGNCWDGTCLMPSS